jgi:hypothetical protein
MHGGKKRQVGRMIFMATNLDVEPLLKAEDDAKKNAFKRDRFNARRTLPYQHAFTRKI